MRFKKRSQLPEAGRTWAGHHHTPTSTGAILLSKMACQPKHIGRQCTRIFPESRNLWQYPSITASTGITLYMTVHTYHSLEPTRALL